MCKGQAVATALISDDDRTRVTRFDFAPGSETGWHVHEYDYVIVALTDCSMKMREPGDVEKETLIPAGTVYRRDKGIEHNVINAGASQMSFVEIELLE